MRKLPSSVRFLLLTVSLPVAICARLEAEALFIRGDADASGSVQVADAVETLRLLFGGGADGLGLRCLDAADSDDDGRVTVSDPVLTLNYLFRGSASPEEPFPGCGGDATDDDLGCLSFGACDNLGEAAAETFGLDTRPPNGTCAAPDRPAVTTGVTLERSFPKLPLIGIVGLYQDPNSSGYWYAVRKPGYIYRFANTDAVTTKTTVLDIHDRVTSSEEGGLLSMAFHPRFSQNGYIYCFYARESTELLSYIVRFKSSDGGATFDPASEQVLFTLSHSTIYHFGGNLAFGPDGYLYVAPGDGGVQNEAKDLSTLPGKMLRLDVDHGVPYSIPASNPFAAGGGRGEIYAWGLRNPWRWSFDRLTGELWLADVGKDTWEEVDKIVRGGNYGWPIREGAHCYNATNCNTNGLIDPVLDYSHASEGNCVMGGYVYRGSKIAGLAGTYIYGDWGNGTIWGFKEGSGPRRVLAQSGLRILSFAQDNDGELFVVSGDQVHKIVASGPPQQGGVFPQTLSDTGLFEPGNPSRPRSCFIPYDINVPFWSDGAAKDRWMMVPDGQKIHVNPDGDWDFPIGTVFVKEFRLAGKIIETRLLIHHDDGDWGGYSYEWDANETDGTLLPTDKTKVIGGTTWTYPSGAQCLQCHTGAAGRSLGLQTAQLNRSITYPSTGRTANELSTMEHIGMFDAPLGASPSNLPAMPSPFDETQSLNARARSYLAANCSHCHRPEGGGRGPADFRYTTADGDVSVCNVLPIAGDLGVADSRLLAPGNPSKSIMSLRMHATEGKMPPIGRNVVDSAGAALIDAWIVSQTTCGAPTQEIILDNGLFGTSYTGNWSASGAPDPYGSGSAYSKGVGAYRYDLSLPQPGQYDVYLWWTQWPSRLANVPVDITHAAGTQRITINQQADGGKWNRMGAWSFGSSASVTIRSLGPGSTCADAVRLVPAGSAGPVPVILDNSKPGTSSSGGWTTSGGTNPYGSNSLYSKGVGAAYTFTVPLPGPGNYEVRVWWTDWSSRNAQVPIDVTHAGGKSSFTVDQRSGGGRWNALGVRAFDSTAVITIRSLGGGTTCADAVMLAPVSP